LALTVTFTVCDARQIGASLSGGAWFNMQDQASLRMVRPEQKSTPALGPLPAPRQIFAGRDQVLKTPSCLAAPRFEYGFVLPLFVLGALCSQTNSRERTRGPPLMDPPTFC
jgi:hypothetical protein